MEFFSLGSFQPARNGKLLSISVDEKGDERYEQRFLNMETGAFLEDTIPNIAAGSFFINHAEQLIYLVPDDVRGAPGVSTCTTSDRAPKTT